MLIQNRKNITEEMCYYHKNMTERHINTEL